VVSKVAERRREKGSELIIDSDPLMAAGDSLTSVG
jgi:hypothetical protein